MRQGFKGFWVFEKSIKKLWTDRVKDLIFLGIAEHDPLSVHGLYSISNQKD